MLPCSRTDAPVVVSTLPVCAAGGRRTQCSRISKSREGGWCCCRPRRPSRSRARRCATLSQTLCRSCCRKVGAPSMPCGPRAVHWLLTERTVMTHGTACTCTSSASSPRAVACLRAQWTQLHGGSLLAAHKSVFTFFPSWILEHRCSTCSVAVHGTVTVCCCCMPAGAQRCARCAGAAMHYSLYCHHIMPLPALGALLAVRGHAQGGIPPSARY